MVDVYQLEVMRDSTWFKCEKYGSLEAAQEEMEREHRFDHKFGEILRYRIILIKREIVWEDPPISIS